MKTYEEVYKEAVNLLTDNYVPEAALDAWYLLEYVTKLKRAEYFLRKNETISGEQETEYLKLIEERAKRIPLQYLTGEQEFMGLCFHVGPATLIPRQDTEILVEEALKFSAGKRVLDLCTGTGCIIISLSKLGRPLEAIGTDISEQAIQLAEENANLLDADVTFYCGDLFMAIPQNQKFDMILSNPPYICSEVINTLQPEVKDYEPLQALDGATDGLEFYRRIITAAPEYLNDGGMLMVEIGFDQAEEVLRLFETAKFSNCKIIKDYAGNNRVVYGTK